MSECLFLVYHNLTSPKTRDWYDLKGIEISSLKRQIDFLCKYYEPLTIDTLIECIKDKSRLPSKCFYLTFDEGFKEHSLLAVQELLSSGIKGGFFCNTQRLEEKRLLTVDKQRFLMYATSDFHSFLISFCKAIKQLYPRNYNEKFEPTIKNIKDASTFYAEATAYSNEERFYRKIRDTYLSEDELISVVDFVFAKYFDNETELVNRYFMDWDDLKYLVGKGMDIGCHTHSHPLLHRLDYATQKLDIHKNNEILTERLGIKIKSIAYPYGSFNNDTIKVLKEEGIEIGFMENEKVDRSNLADPYRLSRLEPAELNNLMKTVSIKDSKR